MIPKITESNAYILQMRKLNLPNHRATKWKGQDSNPDPMFCPQYSQLFLKKKQKSWV